VGLALEALEHYWAGQATLWWSTRFGFVLSYLACILSVVDGRAAWLIPVGLCWFCLGSVLRAEHRAQRLGESVGEALETMFQLLVNTLSFVRVGAFALAHAGLAAAVNALCSGIGSRAGFILGLAVGNAVLIGVEGLVVGIQTTRLILFEFFIRFLRGYGRPFRPLASLPTQITMEPSRKIS
jgi:V/A-type H+-transporting ATPase subunit I